MPPEATQVSPLIPFSPMPGGALTANTQMMRDNNILEKFPEVIKAMREVVEKGGYGTSVTPVSQFYFQQAFNNVMFGPWKKIADGYGKMVLGYFGHTPSTPDSDVVRLASEQLKLEPTTKNALDLADADETKSLAHVQAILEKEGIEINDENLFIAASCKEKGIAYLKGEAKANVRKISTMKKEESCTVANSNGEYTVIVNGERFNVQVSEGLDASVEVKSITPAASTTAVQSSGVEIKSTLPGSVFQVVANVGDSVKEGDVVMILEAMKMEIEVVAPSDGKVSAIHVQKGQSVQNGQLLVTL